MKGGTDMYKIDCKIVEIIVENCDFKVKVEAKAEHQFIFDKDKKYNVFHDENFKDNERVFIKDIDKEFLVNNYGIRNVLLCNRNKLISIFLESESSELIAKVSIND